MTKKLLFTLAAISVLALFGFSVMPEKTRSALNSIIFPDSFGTTIEFTEGTGIVFDGTYPTWSIRNTITNNNQLTNGSGYLTAEVDGSTSNELQNLTYNSGTGVLGITSGNTVTIPTAVTPTVNYAPSRVISTAFTPSTTRPTIGFYYLTCSVTNPLLVGNSTATVKLQRFVSGAWTDVGTNGNSSAVGVAVAIQLTNGQTATLTAPMEANVQYRLFPTTSGTASVTLVGQCEMTL